MRDFPKIDARAVDGPEFTMDETFQVPKDVADFVQTNSDFECTPLFKETMQAILRAVADSL